MKASSRKILHVVGAFIGILAVILLVRTYRTTEGFQSSKPWTTAEKIDGLLNDTKVTIDGLNAEIQKAESERQGKMDSLKAAIDAAVKDIEARITNAKSKKAAIKATMQESVKVLGDRINGLNSDERQGKIDDNGKRKRNVYKENKTKIEAMLKTIN